MLAAVLAIGTELTRGELVNANAAWLAERLTALGLQVVEHCVVPDDSERVRATLARFGREVKLIVCTGGLGPTSDDLTTAAVAELLGVPQQRHTASLERIRARFARAGRTMPVVNEKQADLPEGARVLDNDEGTAPGFVLQVGQARSYFFPGVPREMRHLFERYVEPEISPLVTRTSYQVHLRTIGLRESEVAARLTDLDLGGSLHDPEVVLGYRASPAEIEVKVLAHGPGEAAARALAERVATQVRALLGDSVYGGRDDSYPAYVGRLLRERRRRLAVAESCTGGLLGKLLTDVPGSSEYMLLDIVSYSNRAKRDVLGVDAALLERYGAVSEEVAAAMAEGVLARASADLAVAITGVAGPGGGTAEKPAGTVCFGLARTGGKTLTERRLLPGDRERVRWLSAHVALQIVARAVTAGEPLS